VCTNPLTPRDRAELCDFLHQWVPHIGLRIGLRNLAAGYIRHF
jgi:hypothetical protein